VLAATYCDLPSVCPPPSLCGVRSVCEPRSICPAESLCRAETVCEQNSACGPTASLCEEPSACADSNCGESKELEPPDEENRDTRPSSSAFDLDELKASLLRQLPSASASITQAS
jgi:hypothetical protein